MEEKKEINQKPVSKGCVNLFLIFGLLAIFSMVYSCLNDSPEEIIIQKAKKLEEMRNDTLLNCYIMSERFLKSNLRDPDSYEEIEHKENFIDQKSKKDPYIQVTIKYRAKNGFGGMNIGYKAFNFGQNAEMLDVIDLDK